MKAASPECPSLLNSLKPLRNLTYYCGLLPDWCPASQPPARGCLRFLSLFMTCVGTFLALSLTFIITSYELVQLIIEYRRSASVHAVAFNLLWSSMYLTSLILYLFCLLKKNQFISHMSDWNALEQHQAFQRNLLCFKSWDRSVRRWIFGLYWAVGVVSFIVMILVVVDQAQETYLLSHYELIRETIPAPAIATIHAVSLLHFWLINSVAEMAPAFTFHHAALAVAALGRHVQQRVDSLIETRQLKNTSIDRLFIIDSSDPNLDDQIRDVWAQCERIRRLVQQANQFYSPLMVIAHGYAFTIICCLTYSFLYNIKIYDVHDLLRMFVFLLVVVLRLVLCVLVEDELPQAAGQFRSTLAELLNNHWFSLTDKERHITATFLGQLQVDQLVATPWNLYRVTRSFLLSMLSLTVTYIVILLQAKN